MSNTSPEHPASKVTRYQNQNGSLKLTPAQDRRASKADNQNKGR